MSSLKMLERGCFEELFDMAGGYVLNFTNRTFSEFLRESAGVDIYSDKYAISGDSKARRLRAFIELEEDTVVGKRTPQGTRALRDYIFWLHGSE